MTTLRAALPRQWTAEHPEGEFTASQVLTLCGITYRNLDYWCRVGLISARHAVVSGSGNYRTFTVDDVAVIETAARLVDAGLAIRPAFDAAHRMHANHDRATRIHVGDYAVTIERTTP